MGNALLCLCLRLLLSDSVTWVAPLFPSGLPRIHLPFPMNVHKLIALTNVSPVCGVWLLFLELKFIQLNLFDLWCCVMWMLWFLQCSKYNAETNGLFDSNYLFRLYLSHVSYWITWQLCISNMHRFKYGVLSQLATVGCFYVTSKIGNVLIRRRRLNYDFHRWKLLYFHCMSALRWTQLEMNLPSFFC